MLRAVPKLSSAESLNDKDAVYYLLKPTPFQYFPASKQSKLHERLIHAFRVVFTGDFLRGFLRSLVPPTAGMVPSRPAFRPQPCYRSMAATFLEAGTGARYQNPAHRKLKAEMVEFCQTFFIFFKMTPPVRNQNIVQRPKLFDVSSSNHTVCRFHEVGFFSMVVDPHASWGPVSFPQVLDLFCPYFWVEGMSPSRVPSTLSGWVSARTGKSHL